MVSLAAVWFWMLLIGALGFVLGIVFGISFAVAHPTLKIMWENHRKAKESRETIKRLLEELKNNLKKV